MRGVATATMKLTIRDCEHSDIERIVSYFLDADEEFLVGLGVDLAKLPERYQEPQAAVIGPFEHHFLRLMGRLEESFHTSPLAVATTGGDAQRRLGFRPA